MAARMLREASSGPRYTPPWILSSSARTSARRWRGESARQAWVSISTYSQRVMGSPMFCWAWGTFRGTTTTVPSEKGQLRSPMEIMPWPEPPS